MRYLAQVQRALSLLANLKWPNVKVIKKNGFFDHFHFRRGGRKDDPF